MSDWRLLNLETRNAFMNMAIDEAVLTARIARRVPNTLRFYRWKPSAVSVGRFQKVSEAVHVENCRRHGVDIVRRISGGGAVYHDDEGEITYSVVVHEQDLGSKDVVSAYNMVCSGLVEAAKNLGVSADFRPGNPNHCPNVTIDGKKFSGSAQARKKGVLLQHGTFLMRTGLKTMFTFLAVPWANALDDVLRVAGKRLTSIEQELEAGVSAEQTYEALVEGFQKTLKAELMEQDLTDYEMNLANELCSDKYATDGWNFKENHFKR